MIPKIIHQTARTPELSWEEARMTRRLRRLLPDWEYRFWDDNANSKLIAEHFPRYGKRYDRIAFGVAKADIARYAYLAVFGGFYFDTDYKLLKAIDRPILEQSCVIPLESTIPHPGQEWTHHGALGNAVIGSAKGHPFWRGLIDFIFDQKGADRITEREEIIPVTGPGVVTEYYLANRAAFPDVALPPKNAFQPDIRLFATRTSATAETYGVHLHWGSWRGRSPLLAARILLRRKLNGLLS